MFGKGIKILTKILLKWGKNLIGLYKPPVTHKIDILEKE